MSYKNWFIESKLPEVLTKEEFFSYYQEFKNGSLEAREKLIYYNIRLVIYLVQKYGETSYEKEELVGVGLIGLIKSIDTYDINKNSFVTYASKCINNEILMYIRKNKRHIYTFSLDKELDNNEDTFTLKEVISINDYLDNSFEDIINSNEEKMAIREIIDTLEGRDWDIFKMYYGFYSEIKYTQTEIANIYNLSQSFITRILQKKLREITKILIDYEVIEENSNIKKRCKRTKRNIPNV